MHAASRKGGGFFGTLFATANSMLLDIGLFSLTPKKVLVLGYIYADTLGHGNTKNRIEALAERIRHQGGRVYPSSR